MEIADIRVLKKELTSNFSPPFFFDNQHVNSDRIRLNNNLLAAYDFAC
jgi:hypothetical protein